MSLLNTINDYIYLTSLFAMGTFSAFAFTSYCVVDRRFKIMTNKLLDEREQYKKEKEEEEEKKYENMYNLENVKHIDNDERLDDKYVYEATPDGIVILTYIKNENIFQYWSDKTISYNNLQAAARCFVIKYQCTNYYIKNDANKNVTCPCDDKKCNIEENKEEENKEDDVFIKTSKEKKKEFELKNKVVTNTYKHVGNINDYYDKLAKHVVKDRHVKNITFADFKNKQKEL